MSDALAGRPLTRRTTTTDFSGRTLAAAGARWPTQLVRDAVTSIGADALVERMQNAATVRPQPRRSWAPAALRAAAGRARRTAGGRPGAACGRSLRTPRRGRWDELGQPALVVCLGRGDVQRERWCGDPGQDGFGDLAQLLGRRRQQRRYSGPCGRDRRAVCSRVRAGVNAPEAGTRRRARSPVAGLPSRACAAAIPRQPR
jgi:hypothetical protein